MSGSRRSRHEEADEALRSRLRESRTPPPLTPDPPPPRIHPPSVKPPPSADTPRPLPSVSDPRRHVETQVPSRKLSEVAAAPTAGPHDAQSLFVKATLDAGTIVLAFLAIKYLHRPAWRLLVWVSTPLRLLLSPLLRWVSDTWLDVTLPAREWVADKLDLPGVTFLRRSLARTLPTAWQSYKRHPVRNTVTAACASTGIYAVGPINLVSFVVSTYVLLFWLSVWLYMAVYWPQAVALTVEVLRPSWTYKLLGMTLLALLTSVHWLLLLLMLFTYGLHATHLDRWMSSIDAAADEPGCQLADGVTGGAAWTGDDVDEEAAEEMVTCADMLAGIMRRVPDPAAATAVPLTAEETEALRSRDFTRPLWPNPEVR